MIEQLDEATYRVTCNICGTQRVYVVHDGPLALWQCLRDCGWHKATFNTDIVPICVDCNCD